LYRDDIDWEDEDFVVSRLTSIAICGIEDPVRPEVTFLPEFHSCQVLVIAIKSYE